MEGFRRVGSRTVYTGSVIELRVEEFTGPDGGRFERDVVRHPGAVAVVPLVADPAGPVVPMVRQYRAPLDSWLLEIPAGKRDVPGEPPEETAQRELEEEVGYRAGRLELLAQFHNTPGFCDELSWVFLATELVEVPRSVHSVEEAHMVVERIPLADVPALIASAELTDAKSIIGLALARERLAAGDGGLPPGR